MLSRLVGNLNDEQIVEALKTAVEYIVTHGVVEKVNDFCVIPLGVGENELLPGDQHDVVEKNVVPGVGVVAKRVSHVVASFNDWGSQVPLITSAC